MKEKQFIIPKNVYHVKFELFQNVGLKDLLFFLPSIVLAIPFIFLTEVSPIAKIIFALFSFGIPFMLVLIRPVRENIPAWKHLYWKLDFLIRQNKFYYRKEDFHV